MGTTRNNTILMISKSIDTRMRDRTRLSVCGFEFERTMRHAAGSGVENYAAAGDRQCRERRYNEDRVSRADTVITRRFIRVTNRHQVFRVMEKRINGEAACIHACAPA